MSWKRTDTELDWCKHIPLKQRNYLHILKEKYWWLLVPLILFKIQYFTNILSEFILIPLKSYWSSHPSSLLLYTPSQKWLELIQSYAAIIKMNHPLFSHSHYLNFHYYYIPNLFFLVPHLSICIKALQIMISNLFIYFYLTTDIKQFSS